MILVSEWPKICQKVLGRVVPIGEDFGTELTETELNALGFVEAAKEIDKARANERWLWNRDRDPYNPKRRAAA